eukprot:TRINITY_DN2886_c0_g1_i1.p1 TRINITY_DN2886_c0_g1~~TRINITY_DN2886_c0_g1_i1.p1  ORF type:complete len:325 (+),score=91.02 TRINITY_DN2886_c0_g1_i1:149-1123(+)
MVLKESDCAVQKKMLMGPTKLEKIQRAILADSKEERKRILEELVHLHKEDFKTLFKIMSGKKCIIRILDSPLNTFVSGDKAYQLKLSEKLEIPMESIEKQHASLSQYNPTLGLRGSRLDVIYPEYVQFEAKSIFIAALEAVEEGFIPLPCIQLPMISSAKEFALVKKTITEVAEETGALDKIKYQIGALIEIPRAALTADEIAKEADFLQFGLGDLTQMTCGFSSVDSQLVIDKYVKDGIYSKDPFKSLDVEGVGALMKTAIELARMENKNMIFGICGDHSYDPASIYFSQSIGVNELSCPAIKIPVAKIAAAQAAIKLSLIHI